MKLVLFFMSKIRQNYAKLLTVFDKTLKIKTMCSLKRFS